MRSANAADAPAIVAIYNQGIAARTATFEMRLRTIDDVLPSIADARYPMLVAVPDGGEMAGWAGLSRYRPRECYAAIAEFSIYVDARARGQGVGRVLLERLVAAARAAGFRKLVSRIFVANAASRALCRGSGFREVGIYEKHGQLDGEWLDVVIVERLIPENLAAGGGIPVQSETSHE